MKIDFHGNPIPYPLAVIRSRLLLAGVPRNTAEYILLQLVNHTATDDKHISMEDLAPKIRGLVPQSFLDDYDLLSKYEALRRNTSDVPPLVIALEGASATGKSMLALDIIANLSITRIITTDTMRQVLRGIHSPDEHPELYCHTYQAHIYRQAGPESLDPVLRGYLAQCDLMESAIRAAVENIVAEGTESLVEGVHILPGSLKGINPGIIEILIDPEEAVHRTMFLAKHSASGLKTVSADAIVRDDEFEATRKIQQHMLQLAKENSVKIVTLEDYEQASEEIRAIILESIKQLTKGRAGEGFS
ncbi:MAG: hypothetical protein ACXABY_32375 [Candidatus Thorarchaeota archaeon]|jgi:2-phosphoglycerate kinase